LKLGTTGFNGFGNTGNGSPGSHATDNDIYQAIGIGPDFLGGGFSVNFRVGRVAELLQTIGVGGVFDYFLGPGDR
jgi:hypothetical protein